MMMSIFSSFDALSAELFGQKLSFSKPSSTDTKQQGVGTLVSDKKTASSPPATSSTGILKKAGEASPPPSSRQQQQKRQSKLQVRSNNTPTATMMMSIFSPFDALSAEVCGQKLSFSKALTTHDKTQQGVGTLVTNSQAVASPPSTSSIAVLNKAGEASSSCQNQQKRQRFALEFDGVHCFETIITY
ncbi:hypothetical protein MTR67_014209 [Solanum verrucosum]|uniref:Uncharacterized protein n=2 Tax=Solanum verrucosum TaxID=315347 RepID=A0AAF0QJ22_SOLVR|nr:hypothetical protein MTR67_014209 [Solanum verrucosum]